MPGIKAFTAPCFGGIGSIPARFWGASSWASSSPWPRHTSPPRLANAIVFAVLIVVLLVRPTGMLGKYAPEKV
jgi:branched-chain amino acid transport system permease protein